MKEGRKKERKKMDRAKERNKQNEGRKEERKKEDGQSKRKEQTK